MLQNKAMGFDGKSLINPKQIRLVHEVFAPTEKEVRQAEAVVRAFVEQSAAGVGVFTVNGKEVYQGKFYMDGKYMQKAAPKTRRYEKPAESKIFATVVDALKTCGAKDGIMPL